MQLLKSMLKPKVEAVNTYLVRTYDWDLVSSDVDLNAGQGYVEFEGYDENYNIVGYQKFVITPEAKHTILEIISMDYNRKVTKKIMKKVSDWRKAVNIIQKGSTFEVPINIRVDLADFQRQWREGKRNSSGRVYS